VNWANDNLRSSKRGNSSTCYSHLSCFDNVAHAFERLRTIPLQRRPHCRSSACFRPLTGRRFHTDADSRELGCDTDTNTDSGQLGFTDSNTDAGSNGHDDSCSDSDGHTSSDVNADTDAKTDGDDDSSPDGHTDADSASHHDADPDTP
jgi:hypothetical protein